MTLRHRKLERALRRRTQAHLRSSESLWLEHKRLRKGREYQLPPWLYRGGVLLVVLMLPSNRRPVALLIAMALLWSLGSILLRAHQLRFQLYGSPNLQVFGHQPIADEEVFRIQFGKFLRTSLWSAADFTVVYGVLAFKTGFGANAFLTGLAMGSLHWLTLLALAVGLFACARKRPFLIYAQLFMGSALGLRFFGGTYQTPISNWLAEHAFWFPPLGWTLHVLGINRSQGLIAELWPALSIGISLLLLPMAYQRIRGRYVLGERVRSVTTLSAVQPAKIAPEPTVSGDKKLEPAMVIKESIRTRDFLRPFDWKRAGWLERLAFRWFTPEERLAAEFMTAGKPGWTVQTSVLTFLCVCSIALGLLVPDIGAFAPIFLVVFIGLLLAQPWKGFQPTTTGGFVFSPYAAYPLAFWNVFCTILKVNLLRLALSVMAVAFYVLGVQVLRLQSQNAPLMVFNIGLIFLGLQPVMPIIPFSSVSTDALKPGHFLLIIIGVILLGAAGIVLFLSGSVWKSVAMCVVLSLTASGSAWLYGHAHNHNWFDLMRRPKTKTVTTNEH